MHAEGAGAALPPYCFFGKTPRKTGGDLLAECAKKRRLARFARHSLSGRVDGKFCEFGMELVVVEHLQLTVVLVVVPILHSLQTD